MQSDNDIMPFKNVFNEFYSRDISKKVKSAKIASAKQGNFLGCYAPFGYWRDENDRHKLVIDEEAAVIVRKVFQMRADGLSLAGLLNKPSRDMF